MEWPTGDLIDPSSHPAATWLLGHGLPYDADLHHDLNGDGVSLLMAYALDLDPNQRLQNHLPVPVLNEGALSISFHAAAPGITYTVETSTDLRTWTTDSANLSDLDLDNQRTASVSVDSRGRFQRLVVSEEK